MNDLFGQVVGWLPMLGRPQVLLQLALVALAVAGGRLVGHRSGPGGRSGWLELAATSAEFLAAGWDVAAGGGGFFRVLPYAFSRWAIRQVNRREGRPAVFYFHPWEVDPDQPRVPHAPMRSRFRHYTGLARMAGKLRALVHEFRWGRMDLVAHREAAQAGELVLPASAEDIAA